MNRRVGRAMHDYRMLAHGDRVLVAVSGGMDSLVLAWLLAHWQRKAPISYEIVAIHIAMDEDAAGRVAGAVQGFGIRTLVQRADWRPEMDSRIRRGEKGQDVCFRCARARRRQLFDLAAELGVNKLALGHHRDDLIETFFMNLTCSGNLSTMLPRQDLFQGELAIIRPMAYLDREEVHDLGRRLGLEPVAAPCSLAGKTRRDEIREILARVYTRLPGSRQHIFAALGNVRHDYLLHRAAGAKRQRPDDQTAREERTRSSPC